MKQTVLASLIVVIALGLAVVCAGCTSSTSPSPSPSATTTVVGNGTALGNATHLNVVQGQNFTIQLESNPSAGYHWEPIYDNSTIVLVNGAYITGSTPAPGAPGADVFTFQGTKAGTSVITFNYTSPANETTNSVNYVITCTTKNVPTGNAVYVSKGQNFTIQQPSNPSTGYHWELEYTDATLRLVNETFVSNVSTSNASVVGASGTELYAFRGTEAGTGSIVLSNVSPADLTVSTVPYSVLVTS